MKASLDQSNGALHVRVGVGVIIVKNDTVLLGKRLNAHGQGTWAFPGGHLEMGESWQECALREVAEETGLSINTPHFAAITNDIFGPEKHYITIFMRALYKSGEPQLLEPNKCAEWQWFSWDALPSPIFLTLQNLKKQGYNPFFKRK